MKIGCATLLYEERSVGLPCHRLAVGALEVRLGDTELPVFLALPNLSVVLLLHIVSGKPDGNPSVLPGNINLGMHKFDYSVHVGPSVSVNPWNKLIAAAYFHVMPTATGVLQNDTFAYGFGCMMAAGVSVAYKCISLGVEGLWGKVKYKQASFDGGDDEGDSESYFSTEKFTLKQSGIRAYVAIRF